MHSQVPRLKVTPPSVGPQPGKQDQILHLPSQGEVNYIYAVIISLLQKKITWKHASLLTVTIIDLATYV